MKPILADRTLTIPEGVTVEVKARRIVVKGPRGTLRKDLSHICADIYLIEEEGEKKMKVDCHFRKRKELSALRTVISHVSNMITGVTEGFRCLSAAALRFGTRLGRLQRRSTVFASAALASTHCRTVRACALPRTTLLIVLSGPKVLRVTAREGSFAQEALRGFGPEGLRTARKCGQRSDMPPVSAWRTHGLPVCHTIRVMHWLPGGGALAPSQSACRLVPLPSAQMLRLLTEHVALQTELLPAFFCSMRSKQGCKRNELFRSLQCPLRGSRPATQRVWHQSRGVAGLGMVLK